MQLIAVNIIEGKPGWMRILHQEGIPIDPKSDIWIIDRKITGIKEFLESGGFVLTSLKYIDGEIKRRLNKVDTGNFGYFSGEIGKGYIIALSFDPGYYSYKRKRKSFYSDFGRYPDEAVSYIDTRSIRRTVVDCLRQLFSRKGIPYIHKWYYPEGKSLFALRVDTDFSTAREVINLQDSLQNMGLRATFFLNVLALKNDINNILKGNHCFGIHCYNHTVYADRKRNFENIKRAKEIVEDAGKSSKGFAAPYGIWHKEFPRLLEELGFSYSSEFSYSYDDMPFKPYLERDVLQIPIHPICLESLYMSKHTKQEVKKYFISIIDLNYHLREPTIIYGHPTTLLNNLDILKEIIEYVKKNDDIWITDMDEIVDCWREREKYNLSCTIKNNTILLKESSFLPLEIILPDGKRAICNAEKYIDISKLNFISAPFLPPHKVTHSNKLWLFIRELESRFYMYRNRLYERSNFA